MYLALDSILNPLDTDSSWSGVGEQQILDSKHENGPAWMLAWMGYSEVYRLTFLIIILFILKTLWGSIGPISESHMYNIMCLVNLIVLDTILSARTKFISM